MAIASRNLLTVPSNLPPSTSASAPSPATSLHSPTAHLASLPRTRHSNTTAASSSSTRTAAARQRAKGKAPARRGVVEDSDSDLTPASGSSDDDADMTEDDDEDEEEHDEEEDDEDHEGEGEDDDEVYENLVTPRKGVHKGRSTPTQAALMSSGGAHGAAASSSLRKKKLGTGVKSKAVGKKKSHAAAGEPAAASAASASTSKSKVVKTTTGPAGREKKRAIKIEEAAKRRARDAKFDVEGDFGGAVTPTQSMVHPRPQVEADDTSSYGDDESEHGNVTEDEPAFTGLPDAFMGQEVEDLAYGGGDMDDVMAFWEDQQTDEEDEQMFIDNLSGSEVDRQSQSSVSIDDSDDSMSDSGFSSSTDDGLDEFGFPIPSAAHFPIEDAEGGADPGLVLMENWDGQFVLVQPRAERSRSRHRGERGSRTAGSVSGSTVASGTEQQGEGLLIDPDAAEHEFDSGSASYWSGMSDEDDDGDTTDSMAEEDMPMLDSPALNELMESQMAEAVLRMAVDAGDVSAMLPLPEAITAAGEADMGVMGAGLLVGDGLDVHTPALSTSSSTGPVTGPSANLPQTPGPAPAVVTPSLPAPNLIPQMGTFHPTTGDPAQHAVIDGSGTTTKSPFTHRRRSRRNRDAASMASSSRSKEEKKRKSSAHSHPTDPFSPALSVVLAMGAGSAGNDAAVNAAGKRLRYSSIPGHPRYVAARQAQQQALVDPRDRETTPSDSDAFSLEDMLETEVLMHELGEGGPGAAGVAGAGGHDAEHLRHMIRFDRVGVSTYLRRNFGPGARLEVPHAPNAAGLAALAAQSHPGGVGGVGSPSGGRARALDDTLVGPMGGRMLMSPVLGAVDEEREARRERRRRKKAAGMPELKI